MSKSRFFGIEVTTYFFLDRFTKAAAAVERVRSIYDSRLFDEERKFDTQKDVRAKGIALNVTQSGMPSKFGLIVDFKLKLNLHLNHPLILNNLGRFHACTINSCLDKNGRFLPTARSFFKIHKFEFRISNIRKRL